MTDLKNIGTVYLIGIGGIGMSALARYFKAQGAVVSGYDRSMTSLTDELINEGMNIVFDETNSNIPSDVDLVIYTPAVPKEHPAFTYFIEKNIPLFKRSEVLGMISDHYKTIAIAGTHGKTTTTTLTAHLLNNSHSGCNAFLGGISKNYSANLILNANSENMVVEADEYDRSFLRLHPSIAIITSVDPDHLDIYDTGTQFENTFAEFAKQTKSGGKLILKKGISLEFNKNEDVDVFTYSLDGDADFTVKNVIVQDSLYRFDFHTPDKIVKDLILGIPGRFNLENAVAAMAAASLSGIKDNEMRSALIGFQGVVRRFDIRFRSQSLVYIDDYAHHPTEIDTFYSTIKELYSDEKLTCIFQPHLYSRTRDFMQGFAESLSHFDSVILLPVYAARELPIEGITSEKLLREISCKEKILLKKENVTDYLRRNISQGVLITMGAGDIDTLVKPITQMLNEA